MPESLMHLSTYYGQRAKIGVIVPPTNTTNEAEWQAMTPADVSIHVARMPLHTDTTSDAGKAALYKDIEKYALDLAQADVDVIVYGCTAGSMVSPVSSLPEHIGTITSTKALTTAQAIVDALKALGVQKLAVATPYFEAMNQHEKVFLEENGYSILSIAGLGYGANGKDEFRNIARIRPEQVIELAKQVYCADAEALLISCTDLVSLPVISILEKELDIPVISSNSATFWRALRMASVNDAVESGGRLYTV